MYFEILAPESTIQELTELRCKSMANATEKHRWNFRSRDCQYFLVGASNPKVGFSIRGPNRAVTHDRPNAKANHVISIKSSLGRGPSSENSLSLVLLSFCPSIPVRIYWRTLPQRCRTKFPIELLFSFGLNQIS